MRKIVYVLLPVVFLLVILFCAVFAGAQMLRFATDLPPAQSFTLAEKGRALVISTASDGDFPSAPGLGSKELKAELDGLLDHAQQNGFEAVYFEVTDGNSVFFRSKTLPASAAWVGEEKTFTLFDPLAYLCSRAAQRGVELYALAEISAEEQTTLCTELAGYTLSGVVLANVENLNDPAAFCRSVSSAMAETDPQRKLGLIFDESRLGPEMVNELAGEGILDLVHPIIAAGASDRSYGAALTEWSDAMKGTDAKLAIYQDMTGLNSQTVRDELGSRLTTASLNESVSGAVFSHLGAFRQQPVYAEAALSHFAAADPLPSIDLSFSQELGIHAPAQETIRLPNSYTTYFVSGTSDPGQPLFMDGEELERTTTNGVWGVQVELKMGRNVFTFAQGDQTAKVTIEVYNPNNTAPKPIDRITESSIFPTGDRAYRAGEEITFTCVAPSGARVVANINGAPVAMTQRAATAMWGIPATFSASYVMPSVSAQEVTDLGNITYTLAHNGTTTEYTSAGHLLAAGQEADIVAEVKTVMTGLYNAPTGDGNLAANLNRGTRVSLCGEYQNGRALLEDRDVYIPLADITILTGKQEARQHYKFLELRKTEKGEELVLDGGLNAAYPTYENGLLTITLADTVVEGADSGLTILEIDPADLSKSSIQSPSGLFSRITVQNDPDGSATFSFRLLPGVFLSGWDAYINQDGQAVLYCQRMPSLSNEYAKPLQGITIMVDPGHGGGDIGAPGAAGAGGPCEAQVNLALAHMLRYRLQQLGAEVIMTRTDDSGSTIYDRYELGQRLRPDLYIAVHHNSLAVHRDANEIFYTTGYYFYPQSEQLAKAAVEETHRRTGRDMLEASYAAYYVTRITYAPSILFETGFVSNPREQQDCCDSNTIYQTACALADAICQTFELPYTQATEGEAQ
ncbi:MAG: N-acetylmuramoyl-L-alanine amidase [Oscillospiraceae bacterium]|nr:N-acetylmuramoyl-L-alanine amidase [Oscillospiraceae bacterium]